MASVTPEWSPVGHDLTLKKALDTIRNTSFKNVIKKGPDGQANRFVLQTSGYHSIYVYVTQGSTFEAPSEKFEKRYSKEAFEKVIAVDVNAYNFLRDTTNQVASHTSSFSENGLGRLVTSANGAIVYADHCVGLLVKDKDLSLWANLDILLDPKYHDVATHDDDFNDALGMARTAFQTMSNTAKAKAEDATQMVNLLIDFHSKTTTDSKAVQTIKENWLDGPKDPNTHDPLHGPDGTVIKPYAEIMNAEIFRIQQAIADTIASLHTFENGAGDRALKIGLLGIFTSCWAMGPIINAKLTKDLYGQLTAKIQGDQQHLATIVAVNELVRALVLHFTELLPKMTEALNAMTELQGLFTSQNENFQAIDASLGRLQSGVTSEYLEARKSFIKGGIDETVENLGKMKNLALEFQRSATPEIIRDADAIFAVVEALAKLPSVTVMYRPVEDSNTNALLLN
ncbi:hypothetical protein Micbo1qcDRAFT_209714 [Microdochium bolleyi]|uniref:Uncharacterized protein n=1 Tax=Microdochium bolleyi TaxID=196109 RepID=A0A136ILA8_9PEZI|nr:hypothetical protein Micbo1qcDRAFT_209714 [Microdochium bolleyi]